MFYYKSVIDGKITSVESKSVNVPSPAFIEATEAEYNDFIDSLPIPEPIIRRDPLKELDDLKIQLKLSGVIE